MSKTQIGKLVIDSDEKTMMLDGNGPYNYVGILLIPSKTIEVFGNYDDSVSEDLKGFRRIFGNILSEKDLKGFMELAKNDNLVGFACNFDRNGKFQACVVEEDKEVTKKFPTLEEAIDKVKERVKEFQGRDK